MTTNRISKHDTPSWLWSIIIFALAVGASVASVSYQRPDGTLCQNRLGAGFPFPVVCDASGESPPSSWGRIDWADLDSVNLFGLIADIVLYSLVFRAALMLWQSWQDRRRHGNTRAG